MNISEFTKKNASPVNKIESLPLMHSCDCFACYQIINCKRLEVRYCKVFKENLLYFFYGKPSYPVSEKESKNRTDYELCPVCFIIPFEKAKIHKVYPFDTGAFDAHMYDGFLHHNMKLDNFELDNTLNGIRQYIEVFFGNNENYIRGEAAIRNSSIDPYVDGLNRLLTPNGSFEIDERANTIEVISRESILIDAAVECIILPETLLRVPKIKKFLVTNNIYHMEYTVRRLTAPSRYNEIVFEKAMEFIRMRKGEV